MKRFEKKVKNVSMSCFLFLHSSLRNTLLSVTFLLYAFWRLFNWCLSCRWMTNAYFFVSCDDDERKSLCNLPSRMERKKKQRISFLFKFSSYFHFICWNFFLSLNTNSFFRTNFLFSNPSRVLFRPRTHSFL